MKLLLTHLSILTIPYTARIAHAKDRIIKLFDLGEKLERMEKKFEK